MTEPWIVETVGLRKSYGDVEALSGLDLQVPRGSLFALLGRNGAGKTTTLKLLLGLLRPSGGRAEVFGLAADSPKASVAIRERTGFVSGEKDLYGAYTVQEMVRFTASFFPQWRSDLERRYLRAFGLPLERQVAALSRGARTQLALLLALCRGAELLLLDEPTSGLDPASAEPVLQALVSHVAAEEGTVLFSSNQVGEVDSIADHVAILHTGRTRLAGELDDLRARHCRIRLVFPGPAPEVAFRSPGAGRVRRDGRVLSLLSSAGPEAIVAEVRDLAPTSIDVAPVSLQEIFLETTAEEDGHVSR